MEMTKNRKRRKALHFWTPEQRTLILEHEDKTASWIKRHCFPSERGITPKSISVQRYALKTGKVRVESQFGHKKGFPKRPMAKKLSGLEYANNELFKFKNKVLKSNDKIVESLRNQGIYNDAMIREIAKLLEKTGAVEIIKKEQELIKNL